MREIRNIEMIDLNDRVDTTQLVDILEERGIKTVDELIKGASGCISYKCSCNDDEVTFFTYKVNYQYKFHDGRLIECDEEDEDVIYDFVFYVCEECKEVSYYIEIV